MNKHSKPSQQYEWRKSQRRWNERHQTLPWMHLTFQIQNMIRLQLERHQSYLEIFQVKCKLSSYLKSDLSSWWSSRQAKKFKISWYELCQIIYETLWNKYRWLMSSETKILKFLRVNLRKDFHLIILKAFTLGCMFKQRIRHW